MINFIMFLHETLKSFFAKCVPGVASCDVTRLLSVAVCLPMLSSLPFELQLQFTSMQLTHSAILNFPRFTFLTCKRSLLLH